MANVVFVWHMHQPYYVNPSSRLAMMPWVRLHAVKGYLDMVSILAEFPKVRVNFNLTPVLLLQLQELAQGSVRDLWMEWSRKPAALLEENEQLAILEHFFKIQHDHLLQPFPRYAELFAKRGPGFYRERARDDLRHWSEADFRDLQTWYNLAWCGFTALQLYPELLVLRQKGRDFTEEEKNRVLDIHMEIVARIIPLYAEAEQRGQAELMTTPFFHPILPLIYDSDFAERCMPGRAKPPRFHWPQDAQAQLTLAVNQHTHMFGRPPRGLWPSEGSIAPELIPLMRQAGIEYFCSDEENLFHSLRHAGESADHLELFQGWRVEHKDAAIHAIFREKPLSDFVGFMAARNEPHQAAEHLLTHFRHICDQLQRENELIPIILDGENCWEHFRDGGQAFLRELYGGLEKDPRLISTTVEDYFRRCPPSRTITSLHSGSWIHGDFDIWIGEEEENRAWEILGTTRAFLEKKLPTLSPSARDAALMEIYAAEGSDWFWWYGPDFTTECDILFDDLFRQHLKNVHSLCGEIPPVELDRPIIHTDATTLYTQATRAITPRINGKSAPWFDWVGAGRYLAGSEQRAMFRDDRFLRTIQFGCDHERLYLRCELRRWENFQIAIVFHQPGGVMALSDPIIRDKKTPLTLRGNHPEKTAGICIADEVVHITLPLDALAVKNKNIEFQIKIFHNQIERECYPESAPIVLDLLTPDSHLRNWIL